MPVHAPPHKEAERDPGVEHRVELCRRAVAGDARFSVSRLEADTPGRSYTVDTLRRLHESSPEDELTFIMGGDMAHALPTWHEPEAVLSLATLGVAEREGVGRTDIIERLAGLAGADRIRFFDMPRLDISSSADPPPRGGRPTRSATSCRTPSPTTSTPKGCTDERPQTAGRRPARARQARRADRRLRVRRQGAGHRRARPARRARLHRLLRRSPPAAPTARPRRSTTASTRT